MTFFNFLIIVWTFIIGWISKKIFKSYFNPCNCMNGIWALCSTCSTLGLFELYKPSDTTYIYIFVFLFVFSITTLLLITLFFRNRRFEKISFSNKLRINTSLTGVILLIMLVYLTPVFVKSFSYIVNGDLKLLRIQYLAGAKGLLFSFLQSYVYLYLIRPYFTALSILAAYSIVTESVQKRALIIQAIVGSVTHVFISGGRKEIFNILFFLLIAVFINYKKSLNLSNMIVTLERKTVNTFKLLLIAIPFFGGVLVLITSQRTHWGLGIIGTFWLYLIGPMCYLDVVLNNFDLFAINSSGFLYGKATLGFLTNPISTAISVITGADYQGSDYLINLYAENYYNVSNTARFNAASTILYPFLRDFGSAGILVGTILFSLVVVLIVLGVSSGKMNCFWNCILIFIYFTIFFSIWRYTLLYSDGYMVIPWIFIMTNTNLFRERGKRKRYKIWLKKF